MSKKRMLDLDGLLFDDDLVDRLGGAEGIVIYQLLWSVADDWGGYEAQLGSIALRSGALRITKERVQQVVAALIEAGKIIPYQVQGKTYHWLTKFLKHQKLTNPASPTIPLPPWIQFKEESYPSGKKFAKYSIINELIPHHNQESSGSLPVDYQKATGNQEKKGKENLEVHPSGCITDQAAPDGDASALVGVNMPKSEPAPPPSEPNPDSQPQEKICKPTPSPIFGPADLVTLWNDVGCHPRVQKLTDFRRRKIAARMRERADPAWWREFFKKVRGLRERGRHWLTFDWVIKSETNMLKVIEGHYDDDFAAAQKRAIAGNHQQRAGTDGYYDVCSVQPAAG